MKDSTVTIQSSRHTYSVVVEEEIRKKTYDLIKKYVHDEFSKYYVITDDVVATLYLEDVLNSFPNDVKVGHVIIPSGEESKSFSIYEKVITSALTFQLDRKSIIIALGGGVVGDLAGFVAATYMRGIPFVQMPTTLLAHDSSVGGKVGINHPLGKNMVGSFHAPSLVLYDTQCLLTLPEKEWRSGFAEVVKHGFIYDESFLQWLHEHVVSLTIWEMGILKEMLLRSIQVKANIVEKDEKEQGIRAFLNFGHTLGHAIEAELGYGKMTHGEAVAIGINFALLLSEKYYEVKLPYKKYLQMLEELGFSLHIPTKLDCQSLLERMKRDKKAYDENIRYVLLKEIGYPQVVTLPEQFILEELTKEVERNGEGG